MWGFHDGMGWWMVFGGMWTIAFWASLMWLAFWAIKGFGDSQPHGASGQPLDVARMRLARGEITPGQFEELKKAIQ
jgi:uncharacterized membrane protein